MKFLLILLMALGTMKAQSATGKEKEPVTPLVLESFTTSFRNAENVNWTESKYFFKAEFVFNGHHVSAYFTKAGYLVATARNLVSAELPMFLQMNFRDNYNGYWISDLFEMTKEGETAYYMTIENGDQKIVLQSCGNSWEVYEKRNKF